ncbi:MAG: type II secretion system protein [Planctomycetota bacterium]
MMKIEERTTKGFTLMELMMVIVIVAIISAAALPLISGNSDQAAVLEGAQIESAINHARALARARKTSYQVVFATTDGSITISKKVATVQEKVAEVTSQLTGGTLKTGTQSVQSTSSSPMASKSAGGLTISQTAQTASNVEEESELVLTLKEGEISAVDFDGTDTLVFDDAGNVTAGGTLKVDYSDLYLTIVVETQTGCVSITETRK